MIDMGVGEDDRIGMASGRKSNGSCDSARGSGIPGTFRNR